MANNGSSTTPGTFNHLRTGHFVLHSGSAVDYEEYEEFLRRHPHNPVTTVAGLPVDVPFDGRIPNSHFILV